MVESWQVMIALGALFHMHVNNCWNNQVKVTSHSSAISARPNNVDCVWKINGRNSSEMLFVLYVTLNTTKSQKDIYKFLTLPSQNILPQTWFSST